MAVKLFSGLFMLILVMWSPSIASAQDDLLPGKPIRSPEYIEYNRESYILDYVPPNDPPFLDVPYILYMEMMDSWMNVCRTVYLYVVELAIRLVNLGYDDALFEKLFNFLDTIMPEVVKSIWSPLWFLVAGIGIFTIILIWGHGKTNQALMSLLALIVVVGFAPVVISSLPNVLDHSNKFVATLSGEIMGRLIYSNGKTYLATKLKEIEKKEKDLDASFKNATNIREREKLISEYKKLLQQADITSGQSLNVTIILHTIDDTMWAILVKKPYLIANWGSVEFGEKYFVDLMDLGDEEEKRDNRIRDLGRITNDKGIAQNPDFEIFTTDGYGLRLYKLLVATLLAIIPLYLVLIISVSILLWKARAIGRAVFFLFYCLMALYPGYGISQAIRGLVDVLTAFLICLYYSIALSIFFAIWMRIMDDKAFQDTNFADQMVLIFLLVIGMWYAAKEIQGRLSQVPGLSGSPDGASAGNQSNRGLIPYAFMGTLLMRGFIRNPIMRSIFRMTKRSVGETVKGTGKGMFASGKAVGGYLSQIDSVQNLGSRIRANLPLSKTQRFQPKEMTLTANLSQGARRAFHEMKRFRLNPTNKKHLVRYMRRKPNQVEAVQELAKWQQLKLSEQIKETPNFADGYMIPVKPPPKNTPEHLVWMNSPAYKKHYKMWLKAQKTVHKNRREEYGQKKARHDQSWIRRTFRRRPQWVEPTQRETLKEYQRLLKEQQQKR